MIYVLILMMANANDYRSGVGGVAPEFNTIEACRAAAAEVVRQAKASSHVLVVVCAAKGVQK